jgi:hypothetical protein
MVYLEKSAWYNQFDLSNEFYFSHEQLQQDMVYKSRFIVLNKRDSFGVTLLNYINNWNIITSCGWQWQWNCRQVSEKC